MPESSRRPSRPQPPAHLSPSPPVPEPRRDGDPTRGERPDRPDPTRYGDWEKNGVAVDF